MEDKKIYVFGYASIQDKEFYENLISNHKNKRPAILNGYVTCVDSENNILIKKDAAGRIKGFIFEVSKEELFMIDRWNKFPHYQRHIVNVIAEDNNEIIEDVQVYTKLEFGEVFLAPEDKETLEKFYKNEDELKSFIAFEKMNKNFPIIDNCIVYKLNDIQFDKIKDLNHPYLILIIEDIVKKNYLFEHYALIPIKLKNKNFALLVSFSQNKNLNSIFYHDAWENEEFNKSFNILWKPLYEFDASFLGDLKPHKYINLKWDLNSKVSKIGGYNEKTYEYILPNFDIDPLVRLDSIISVLKKFED